MGYHQDLSQMKAQYSTQTAFLEHQTDTELYILALRWCLSVESIYALDKYLEKQSIRQLFLKHLERVW